MKSSTLSRQLIIGLLVLALAQLACSLGSQSKITTPQQPPAGGAQSTQPPAATVVPATAAPTTAVATATAASGHGTLEEAQAMLAKAVAHYNQVGRAQALADFTQRVAPFFDRDLYVACIASNLTQSANGGYPNLVGSSTEPLSRAAWDAASTGTVSSISYQWLDPATGTTEPKTFYYEKVGTDVCGVGAYHPL